MKVRKTAFRRTIFATISGALMLLCQNCSISNTASTDASRNGLTSEVSQKYVASDGQSYQWKPMAVGAGGWLTGIDISPDGVTRLVRTDTYGAYIWDASVSRWQQLVTSKSLPASVQSIYTGNAGVYEIRVAPSDTNRIYMVRDGFVFRSNDRGVTWLQTALPQITADANASNRHWGQKIAIDPINPDVLYVGSEKEGLFVTFDGGSTYSTVSGIPAVTSSGAIAGLAFNQTAGATSGRTNMIYAESYGNGVFRSSNAGQSFTRLSGGPASVKHGRIASDGDYYVIGDDGNSVYRLHGDSWLNITPPGTGDWQTIATDPFDPSRIVISQQSGQINMSLNRGGSWVGAFNNVSRMALDIPWLAWTQESYMSTGDMTFDPILRNRLYFSQGIGVWYADLLPSASGDVTWNSQSAGIEQLCANRVIAPLGGKPLVANWDRPVFRIENPDIYPSTHGPDRNYSISMGWSIDYASNNPNFIALLSNFSGGVENSSTSSDGGQTWTKFPSMPPTVVSGDIGGSLAAATSTNIVIVPSGSDPYVTSDGGKSWKIPTGLPSYTSAEWHWAYYLKRQILAADRVNVGTFYLWSHKVGLYRSTDGGQSFQLMSNPDTHYSTWYNTTLVSVPDRAGHLFLTGGPSGGAQDQHPVASNTLFHSTDGGSTWKEIPDVAEALSVGFGKSKTVGGYPSIYFAGYYRTVFGIYRSDDEGVSWTKIADYPIDSLDMPLPISGDMNEYGKVYVGFNGSGWAYGQLTASGTSPTPTPAPTPTPTPSPTPSAGLASGRYQFTMVNSGKVLTAARVGSSFSVVQMTANSTSTQQFDVTVNADASLQVKSVSTGQCWSFADENSGTPLLLSACLNTSTTQKFSAIAVNGFLSFARSGMCVDVPSSQTIDGIALWQYQCNGSNAQLVKALSVPVTLSGGRYTIKMESSAKYLTVTSTSLGSNVVQKSAMSGSASQYDVSQNSDGSYRIKNVASKLCWGFANNNSGSLLVQQTCSSSKASQKFALTADSSHGYELGRFSTSLCVDIKNQTTNENALAIENACQESLSQHAFFML